MAHASFSAIETSYNGIYALSEFSMCVNKYQLQSP
jgi:hypothetical protein